MFKMRMVTKAKLRMLIHKRNCDVDAEMAEEKVKGKNGGSRKTSEADDSKNDEILTGIESDYFNKDIKLYLSSCACSTDVCRNLYYDESLTNTLKQYKQSRSKLMAELKERVPITSPETN